MQNLWIALGIVGGLIFLIMVFVLGQFANLWVQALFSNARVSLAELIGSRLRKVYLRTSLYSRVVTLVFPLVPVMPMTFSFWSGWPW